jgi:glyoxylase-like metal-dependent hydrolase (beta-lactamase superfamily II)
VCGEQRAALIDTGLGIEPIGAVVRRLTDRPVMVVNTHYHFDHVGGNHEFDEIAVHALGAKRLTEPARPEYLNAYMRLTEERLALTRGYQALHDRLYELDMPELRMRPLPRSFDSKRWHIKPSLATRELEDGDVIDLRWASPQGHSHPRSQSGWHQPSRRRRAALLR